MTRFQCGTWNFNPPLSTTYIILLRLSFRLPSPFRCVVAYGVRHAQESGIRNWYWSTTNLKYNRPIKPHNFDLRNLCEFLVWIWYHFLVPCRFLTVCQPYDLNAICNRPNAYSWMGIVLWIIYDDLFLTLSLTKTGFCRRRPIRNSPSHIVLSFLNMSSGRWLRWRPSYDEQSLLWWAYWAVCVWPIMGSLYLSSMHSSHAVQIFQSSLSSSPYLYTFSLTPIDCPRHILFSSDKSYHLWTVSIID